MKKLILFLVRKHLGVRKYELFRFPNQISKTAVYYFDDDGLMKTWWSRGANMLSCSVKSRASLNWLLDDECYIEKFE